MVCTFTFISGSLNELYNNLIPPNEFLNKNSLSHLSLIPVVASSCLLPAIRASVDKGLKLGMKKDIILFAMVATKMIWVYNNALLRKELGELIMKTTTRCNTFFNDRDNGNFQT